MTETGEIYSTTEEAFDFFNKCLVDGSLPRPIFTLQQQSQTAGYFRLKNQMMIATISSTTMDNKIPSRAPAISTIISLGDKPKTVIHIWGSW
ncbi:MAG: hypothetical protein AAF902_21275 [Chloroflexota bacterium]